MAWAGVGLALSLGFLASNVALQYGASRLNAHAAALIMLSEVVFASLSAVALGVALAAGVPEELTRRVERLAAAARAPRRPVVGCAGAPMSPMVWGARPRRGWCCRRAVERLGRGQRDDVLAHELAHLRRGDHWVRRLELVVTGPVLVVPGGVVGRRQLREAEEECCDAWVVWPFPGRRPTPRRWSRRSISCSQVGRACPPAASGSGRCVSCKGDYS